MTVEAIAQELGMAKSSLYTWFSNKSEMIITLIRNEMSDMSPFYIPWLFSMPVFVVVQGRIHRFSKETMCGILRILFSLVCGGVESRNSNFNTDIIGEIK